MVFCIGKNQKGRDKLEREREINWTAMVLSRTADYRLACWATDHGVDAGSHPEKRFNLVEQNSIQPSMMSDA